MASRVFLHELPPAGELASLEGPRLGPGLAALTRALEPATTTGPWGLKVQPGPPNRPAAVAPAWANEVARGLGATAPGSFCGSTLSITTPGLDKAAEHMATAEAKGFDPRDKGLPYRLADGPEGGAPVAAPLPKDSTLVRHTVAGAFGGAANLGVLTAVRPHPHAGLNGAVMSLGLGLANRAAKIALHADIRPQVDTPLCAGCGVCMTVCVFDAIKLKAGRAYIDHEACTGCGACMNVCFMAGIEPTEAAGIPLFQAKVADAARAAVDLVCGAEPERAAYFSFLVRLDRTQGATRPRDRSRLGDIGVLASRDPVALDQAVADLLAERAGGELASWSGFQHTPEALLARAESVGLGARAYTLVTV